MVIVIKNAENVSEEVKAAIEVIKNSEAEVVEGSDVLDVFCADEAAFRLDEYHGVKYDEQDPDKVSDVKCAIRDIFDNWEVLHDKIDCKIENVLEEI